MSRYNFSQGETYAVYETLGGKCFWCDNPFGLIDCTVDHVIPESVEPEIYKDLKIHFGLHEDFDLNNFYNWVPSHLRCNQSKQAQLYGKSPAFIKVFSDLAKNAVKAEKVATRIDNNKPNAKNLASLFQWIEKRTLSPEEVNTLLKMLQDFYKELPSEISPEEEITLELVPEITIKRSGSFTRIIPKGAFIRTDNADAKLVIEKGEGREFIVKLSFLGQDYFSLSKGAQWQFTNSNVDFDETRFEFIFRVDTNSGSDCNHAFHLEGPRVLNEVADSFEPPYSAGVEFHNEAAIITEKAGLGIFESIGRTFAGTYLNGYGTKIEDVVDRLGIPAISNVHPNPDPSWECPHCGGNIWSGTQCRQCGMLVDPWD